MHKIPKIIYTYSSYLLMLAFMLACLNVGSFCLAAEEPKQVENLAHEPVLILLQWIPQAQFAGYIIAKEKGFFAEEGVPLVELHWADLGVEPLLKLSKGEVDFATAFLVTGLQRRTEGLPIVNIGQFMQSSASMVVARKDKGINSIKDLNGKIILGWGGDFALELDLFLRRNSIVPAKLLPLSTSLAPFLYGLADAIQSMEYSEYQRLLIRGMKSEELTTFFLADYKVNLVGDGLYTSKKYLNEKRVVAQAVLRAVKRGWEYTFAHTAESAKIVINYSDRLNFRTNYEYQLRMLQAIHKGMEPIDQMGILSQKNFSEAVSLILEYGLDIQNLSYEDFFQTP